MILCPEYSALAARPELQPYDEDNQTLAANVHPVDWTNPKPTARYNLVVIDAGTAGLPECRLRSSKAIISAARAAAAVRDPGELGTSVNGFEVDFAKIMQRMR